MADTSERTHPLLLLLLAASGGAALIYEIVWFQFLQSVIGSSAVSMGVLLATFMGGMALGSAVLPYLIRSSAHPLRVFGHLELAIGACGLLVLVLMPSVGRAYGTWGGGYGTGGVLLRGAVAGVCLLPPTMAMGATLPVISRWLGTTPAGMRWLGLLYGANIAGAVAGCLAAGFYLLRVYDTAVATYVAATVNGAVAVMAIALSALHAAPAPEPAALDVRRTARLTAVHAAIALSGFAALASQAIWTRLLGLVLGPTVYTFSIILAVFLSGLGLGSGLASLLVRRGANARIALGCCQLLLVAAVAWAAFLIVDVVPYWMADAAAGLSPWQKFLVDAIRTSAAVAPASILWGASFPLAVAALANPAREPGRLVGGVYAINTLGAVIGAIVGSLVLVPWIGSHGAQRTVMAASVIAGLACLFPASLPRPATLPVRPALASVLGAAAVALLLLAVPPVSGPIVAYGRQAAAYRGSEGEMLYVGEGMNSSVAITRDPGGILHYHNGGKIQASSNPWDMRLQRMLGHLTTLVPEQPRSVLVIGCGAGVTAGTVSIDPAVEHVTIVEIEPLVPKAAAEYFGAQNHDVLRSPKTRLYIDDARHYLVTTKEKFDAITSDPLDPWIKGSATLYTKELFELVRERLNPGGIVTLFVQLYQSTPEAVKSEIATFFEVFPHGVIWGNTVEGRGYDMVLMGQLEPHPIDLEAMQERLSQPEYANVARSLEEVGIASGLDLAFNYAGRADDLGEWLRDATINSDRNLRLQYLAGFAVNRDDAASIYADLERHRRFPTGLFSGGPGLIEPLRQEMRPPLEMLKALEQ